MKSLWLQKLRKQENKKIHPKKEPLTTSKKLIYFLFLNCTLIEIFTAIVTMWSLKISQTTLIAPDFSAQTALIGAVIGEVIGYAVYSLKSMKQNCKGGIIYDKAIQEKKEQPQDGLG